MRYPACEKSVIHTRTRDCRKHSSCALLLLTGVYFSVCKFFVLNVALCSRSSFVAHNSRRETRKTVGELAHKGHCLTFRMQKRRRVESGGEEGIFTSAQKRVSTSFLLRRAELSTDASGRFHRPPSSTLRERYTQRESGRQEVIRMRVHARPSLSRRALCIYRKSRLTGPATAERAKGACATHGVTPSRKHRLQGGDTAAFVIGRMKDGTQCIRPVPSMAPSSVRRYPQGSHASDGNTKHRGRKRKALEGKSTGGISPRASAEAKQSGNGKPAAPAHRSKAQRVKNEAATKDEGFKRRPSKKTGETRDIPASAKKQSKQEAASSTKEDGVWPEIDGLFLAHRGKALRTEKYLGAHISAAGGPQNAPVNCLNVGGQAFAFFLKNQRRWQSPPISEESAQEFKKKVESLGLDGPQHILPHGSYLINLANPDPTKRKTSFDAFMDDLRRCEQLGIQRYVLHPGSTVGACDKSEGIANVASCVSKGIAATQQVTILLENMAGQKNVLCSTFEDLRDIIEKIERKDRVGVCLDTCHLFAAGFDIRTADGFEKVMKSFDAVVGMKYLKGMHINDSKSDLSSGLDRHEHLGKGTIGIAAFKFIMQHPHWFKNMPLIIETPEEGNAQVVWREEIRRLYDFIDS